MITEGCAAGGTGTWTANREYSWKRAGVEAPRCPKIQKFCKRGGNNRDCSVCVLHQRFHCLTSETSYVGSCFGSPSPYCFGVIMAGEHTRKKIAHVMTKESKKKKVKEVSRIC